MKDSKEITSSVKFLYLNEDKYSDSTALFTTLVWTRDLLFYAISFLVFIQIMWQEEAEKADPNQSGYKDFFFNRILTHSELHNDTSYF